MKCLLGFSVPAFDGMILSIEWKEALWARFFTAAPRQLRRSPYLWLAIQHSQESVRVLAERYSINPKTVSKWKQRETVGDHKPGPNEAHSTVLTAAKEDVIVAFRRYTLLPLDDCLHSL
jgi:hypothetical protein